MSSLVFWVMSVFVVLLPTARRLLHPERGGPDATGWSDRARRSVQTSSIWAGETSDSRRMNRSEWTSRAAAYTAVTLVVATAVIATRPDPPPDSSATLGTEELAVRAP